MMATDPIAPFIEADGVRRPYYAPPEVLRLHLTNTLTELELNTLLLPLQDATRVHRAFKKLTLGINMTQFPWLPFEPTKRTRVAFTTAYRIFLCEQLRRREDIEMHVRVAAGLWADAHIPFIVHVERSGSYADAVTVPLLTRFEPRCEFIMHPGALPNVTSFLTNFGDAADARDNEFVNVLKRIVLKPMPQRCVGRGFGPMVLKASEKFPQVRELMRQVLLNGLIGSYDAHTRPPFPARKMLYNLMVLNRTGMEDVLQRVQGVLFHLMREYIIYNVKCLVPLSVAIQKTYPWEDFCKNSAITIDAVRQRLTRNFDRMTRMGMPRPCSDTAIFNGLSNIKPVTVPKRQKPPEAYVARVVLGILHSVQEHIIEDMMVTESSCTRTILANESDRVIGMSPNMVQALGHLKQDPFNIDHEFVEALARGVTDYEVDGNRDKIHALILKFSKTHIPQYETLCVFFNQATIAESIRVIELPEDIKTMQMVAMHNIVRHAHNGDPNARAPLPSNFAICKQCLRFCGFESQVMESFTPHSSSNAIASSRNACAMGHRRLLAMPDLLNDDIEYRCGIRSERTDSKRRSVNVDPVQSHGEVQADTLRDNRKRAREQRSAQQQIACRNTEVSFYDLGGNALKIVNPTGTGKIVMLCTTCAQPFTYNPRKIDILELSCERCTILAKRTPALVKRCVMCDTRMPVPLYSRRWNSRVVMDNLDPSQRPRWFENWETPGTCERHVWFCPRHINPWVMDSETPLPLDAVLFALRKDPQSGAFSVSSFPIGGVQSAFERKWSRAATSHRPAMFEMEAVNSSV